MRTKSQLIELANDNLKKLCFEFPNRSVGRPINRQATDYFKQIMLSNNFITSSQYFDCLEWYEESAELLAGQQAFNVHVSPYTLGCQVQAPLVAASTVDELKRLDVTNKILLLHSELTQEQLMPKNFVFYNPKEHQLIYELLESKSPLAIITATGKNPELAGSMYPFPMIEDGDFYIPSVYMKDVDGKQLLDFVGQTIKLNINSKRESAKGENIVAQTGKDKSRRLVICAHIDTKENTPGALDNGSGIVVLMLLANLLEKYNDSLTVELVALNGEDYYSAPGQIKYLEINKQSMADIILAINMDGAGYCQDKTAYSFYNVLDDLKSDLISVMDKNVGFVLGESWHQSDHMIFAMNQVPALAITSHHFMKNLSSSITHTPLDQPDLVDVEKLVEIAQAIEQIIRKLN